MALPARSDSDRARELVADGRAVDARLDRDVIAALLASSDHREGALFQGWHSRDSYHLQLGFLKRVLEEVRPARILETGTQKASFCYLAKALLPDVRIVTFGIDPESQQAVDILNGRFGHYVDFILGDSRRTLPRFPSADFDLAWIDGGHPFDVCASDLEQCARLGIPQLLVDDLGIQSVQEAVARFRVERSYEWVDCSSDERLIARLVRRHWRVPRVEPATDGGRGAA